jgi:hypothetical protein
MFAERMRSMFLSVAGLIEVGSFFGARSQFRSFQAMWSDADRAVDLKHGKRCQWVTQLKSVLHGGSHAVPAADRRRRSGGLCAQVVGQHEEKIL